MKFVIGWPELKEDWRNKMAKRRMKRIAVFLDKPHYGGCRVRAVSAENADMISASASKLTWVYAATLKSAKKKAKLSCRNK